MSVILILKCIGIIFFAMVATISFLTMFKVIARPNEYESNKVKTGSLKNAFFGSVSTFHNGCRDSSVHAGIVVDTKKNSWVEQGALSDGSIDSVLKR